MENSVFEGNLVFRARRYLLGLTQPKVASRVGLSAPDISRIEAQGWLPPVAMRAQLAEVLGMPAEELFGPQPDLGPRPDAIVLREGLQAARDDVPANVPPVQTPED